MKTVKAAPQEGTIVRIRQCLWLCLMTIVVGCNIFPSFVITPPSPNMNTVVGGLSNTDPFFGTYRLANAPNVVVGDFLLGSCGCGDWRVLFRPTDGGPQVQFPVQFYTNGEYSPFGDVLVHGSTDYNVAGGMAHQDEGFFEGKAELALARYTMSGNRGDAHLLAVDACGMCHIGEDPIWPLPPTHPQKYKTNPRVCFECHSANGQ